jgi:flagellar biosynthesis protein FliR
VNILLDPAQATTFVLASVRLLAFLLVAPPFANASVPIRVKIGLSAVLALVVTPSLTVPEAMVDTAGLLTGVVFQAAIGISMGFAIMVMFAAVQSAGALIDYSAALSSATIFDPFSSSGLSPMARLHQILATLLLFSSGGYLLFLAGVMRSFQAAPLGGLELGGVASTLTRSLGDFFVAALQIGLPLIAALFMAELLLGLLAKAAPQMNLLVVGFGVKSLILLGVGGLTLPLLPQVVEMLVDMSLRAMAAIAG